MGVTVLHVPNSLVSGATQTISIHRYSVVQIVAHIIELLWKKIRLRFSGPLQLEEKRERQRDCLINAKFAQL